MNKVKFTTVFICAAIITFGLASCKDNNFEPVVSSTQLTDLETTAVAESVEDNIN